jgi:hypothetical protein
LTEEKLINSDAREHRYENYESTFSKQQNSQYDISKIPWMFEIANWIGYKISLNPVLHNYLRGSRDKFLKCEQLQILKWHGLISSYWTNWT